LTANQIIRHIRYTRTKLRRAANPVKPIIRRFCGSKMGEIISIFTTLKDIQTDF